MPELIGTVWHGVHTVGIVLLTFHVVHGKRTLLRHARPLGDDENLGTSWTTGGAEGALSQKVSEIKVLQSSCRAVCILPMGPTGHR